ncbi:Hypothetical predicted protein [Olea europaea subsp. europaea]|uniref:Secreted protein n=1 Tax=Olea europaea subsp. europaea TaxID=158383 RepID=A0A8S0UN15_OLEEU|nr:Hypothetical predicted protein [Olea europaea subsp. europaea]
MQLHRSIPISLRCFWWVRAASSSANGFSAVKLLTLDAVDDDAVVVSDLWQLLWLTGGDGGEMRVGSCFGSAASRFRGCERMDLVATMGVEMVLVGNGGCGGDGDGDGEVVTMLQ